MKYATIRNNNINYYENATHDDGAKGKAFELECARLLSHKTTVAKQGEIDVKIKMYVNDKITYVPAECKINGGRIDSLIDGTNKAKFVIYKLHYIQKLKDRVEERNIEPVVIPTELFINMLTEINAIKTVAHGGIVDGLAIQPSSKKMYNRLLAYIENYGDTVLFDNEKVFDDWGFEGLEL